MPDSRSCRGLPLVVQRGVAGRAGAPHFACMDFTIGTPALLFPAISLLMLAFTNRFLAVAAVIRSLHQSYRATSDPALLTQVRHLRDRVHLIRQMQFFAILSILVDFLSMLLLFAGSTILAKIAFGAALLLMMASLVISALEIHISVKALEMHVEDMLGHPPGNAGR